MDKYPARFIGGILRFGGWAAVVIGIILFIGGLTSLGNYAGNGNPYNNPVGAMGALTAIPRIIGGMILALNGLLAAAAGELIKVFLNIEKNTADTTNQLHALENVLKPNRFEKPSEKSIRHDSQSNPAYSN